MRDTKDTVRYRQDTDTGEIQAGEIPNIHARTRIGLKGVWTVHRVHRVGAYKKGACLR